VETWEATTILVIIIYVKIYIYNNIIGFDMFSNQQQQNHSQPDASSQMKQIFSNSDITIYCSSSKVNNDTTNANLFISNNIDKQLLNVKINLFVIKYVSYKVISTSGSVLEPRQSFGIKKVNN